MGTRSVRLDDDAEKALARLTKMTGLTISQILKRGLASLEEQAKSQDMRRPFDVYRELDLGPGGYAVADARNAKAAAAAAIREKHGR